MKRISKIAASFSMALAALASPAWAEQNGRAISAELSAGGGVTGFIEGASDVTKVGGQWDVRLRLRTPIPLGVEVGYVGTANGVSASLAEGAPDAIIVGNGFEANAVLSLLPATSILDPYIFAGAGYTRFSLVNTSTYDANLVRKNDDAFVFPSGAGVSVRLARNFLADARFTYRAIFDDGMLYMQGPTSDALNMSQWGITARLAYAF